MTIRNKNAYLRWESSQPAAGVMPGPQRERIEVPCWICNRPTPVTVATGSAPPAARCANCAINGRTEEAAQ